MGMQRYNGKDNRSKDKKGKKVNGPASVPYTKKTVIGRGKKAKK